MLDVLGGPARIAIIGLGGVAAFGGLMLLFRRFTEGKGISREALHKVFQKEKQEEIKATTKKQEILVKQLKLAEQTSTESRKEIDKIAKDAAVKINKILAESSISKISEEIDKDWEDL
jgi:galactokinase/mevalonate kinase-like predicted kinase